MLRHTQPSTPNQGQPMTITKQAAKAQTAAAEIVSMMTEEDRQGYTEAGWSDGVSSMLTDEWAHLDLLAVLAEITAQTKDSR